MTEKQHNISESADKIRVETKVKRGSGTRDQDEIKIKVKGNDPTEVVQQLNRCVSAVRNTAGELRNMQPGEE
jgi:hypothetical protein